MKLAIIGSRTFTNKNRLFLEINEYRKELKLTKQEDVTEIVSGGASGADKLAEDYAKEYKLKIKIFEADWTDIAEPCHVKINKMGKEYNALAGFNRNSKIIDYCDKVISFWDFKSPGTADSIEKARTQGKSEKIIKI